MTTPLLSIPLIALDMGLIIAISVAAFILLTVVVVLSFYKKVPQGKALVRTGFGGIKVSFSGIIVVPVLHKLEIMDMSLKKVEINRTGKDGLICKDNMRADIKVVFFVKVNQNGEDVRKVAQNIGTVRASKEETLVGLFEAKFSEALKTVGKQFDFVELYDSREEFRRQIVNTIGKELNGYVLDDAAIDYLEQTPVEFLQDKNILDSEGIKKIADLTAKQHIAANKIRREEEKVITQQNVEAQEAILELNRQLAEKEEIQKREIASIKAREEAEIKKIQENERLKAESARITTAEELAIAEENRERQIIVAAKAKERTEKVETERVERERALEQNDRERVVTLAQIEKEKALEEEKKNIQDVIRERVTVEKAVVEEEEKIKDTKAYAEANRTKGVALTLAEKEAQEALIRQVQKAEAEKKAAEIQAQKVLLDADAELAASERQAEAKKKMAEAVAAEEAAMGIAEAQVIEAKAEAKEREGQAQANILSKMAEAEAKKIELAASANEQAGLKEANVTKAKALADAQGKEAWAEAVQKEGLAEAKVQEEKLYAEAKGIEKKADAMKKLDGVGKDHEEFKLRLQRDLEIELARIGIQKDIAAAQAEVIAEALKSANIDIVGGEQQFFDKIVSSITQGRSVDALMNNSQTLSDVKTNLLSGEGGNLIEKIRGLIGQTGLSSNDVKNLSIAGLLLKMSNETSDSGLKDQLLGLLNTAWSAGVANNSASDLGL